MDWRSILDDERRRRANSNSGTVVSRAVQNINDRQNSNNNTDNQGDGGGNFFGDIGNFVNDKIVKPVEDVGGFFGNLVKGVVEPAVNAATTAGTAIASDIANVTGLNGDIQKTQDKGDQQTQDAISQAIQKSKDQSLSSDQRDRWKKLASKYSDEQTNELSSRSKDLDKQAAKLDPVKFVANAGETAVNLLSGGAAGAVKNVAKEGAKELIEQGSKAALQTVAKNAGKGAALGAASGALQPLAENGGNTKPQDIWQSALFGGATGGALGGAGSLLSKNVRAGLKEVPSDVKQGAANFKASLPQGAGEAGYIKNPLAGPEAKPNTPSWAPEGIKTDDPAAAQAEQTAQEVASQYNSPQQYLDERAKMLHSEESQLKGGQKIDTGSPDDPYTANGGVKRISEHSKWYRDAFAQKGSAPSQAEVHDVTEQALNGNHPGVLDPGEERVYDILKENEAAHNAQVADPSADPRVGQFNEFQSSLQGTPAAQSRSSGGKPPARMPAGLPKGPGQTAPLNGLAPEDAGIKPRYDSPADVQAALGAKEAETNPAIDYVDPRATAPPPPAPGAQTALETANPDPYNGMAQDLSRPALPAGDGPQPMTISEARAHFKKTGETPTFIHTVKDTKNPLEMPANTDELNVSTRTTASGKTVPASPRIAANVSKDDFDQFEGILKDAAAKGTKIKIAKTEDLNSAAARLAGKNTDNARFLYKFLVQPRATANKLATEVSQPLRQQWKNVTSGINTKASKDLNGFIETTNPEDEQTMLVGVKKKYGDDVANSFVNAKKWWTDQSPKLREYFNAKVIPHAGQDAAMGDLTTPDYNYVPRVEESKQLLGLVKDRVLAAQKNGLSGNKVTPDIGSLDTGYNVDTGSLNAGGGRNSTQTFLGSEFAKPNSPFLSYSKARTAFSPSVNRAGAVESIDKYLNAVPQAAERTPVIAKERSLVKSLQDSNEKSGGGLERMIGDLDEHTNLYAGKTHPLDRWLNDTNVGNTAYKAISKITHNISRATILLSPNSALTQAAQIPSAISELGEKWVAQGFKSQVAGAMNKEGDAFYKGSNFLPTRYPKIRHSLSTSTAGKAAQKGTDISAKPFELVERNVTQGIWRAAKLKSLSEGMSNEAATTEADRLAGLILGDRSPGMQASLFQSKTLAPLTTFQLEVNQAYQLAKRQLKDPKKAVRLLGSLWAMGIAYRGVTGNDPLPDPGGAATDAVGDLSKGNVIGAAGRIGGEVLGQTPAGNLMGGLAFPETGYKVPFSNDKVLSRASVFGNSNVGRYGGSLPIQTIANHPLYALGIPGTAQLERSVQGSKDFNAGGSFTKDGDTKFTIDQTPENYWRSLLFGIYNTPEGQAYLKSQQAKLSGSQ